MSDKSKQQYIDFEAYERVAEPHKRERASAWRTAIGLQDVDGLKVSDYLKETAVRHIEGDITIDDVREQLKSYYVNKTTHDEDDAEKEEADRVAANIAKLLSEKSFSFTALEFLNVHRHLFEGVFKHAGEVRPYDISKKEWILQGDTVVYGRAADIMMALRYDIQQEKDFNYKGLSTDEIISHIVDFVTLLWQTHGADGGAGCRRVDGVHDGEGGERGAHARPSGTRGTAESAAPPQAAAAPRPDGVRPRGIRAVGREARPSPCVPIPGLAVRVPTARQDPVAHLPQRVPFCPIRVTCAGEISRIMDDFTVKLNKDGVGMVLAD